MSSQKFAVTDQAVLMVEDRLFLGTEILKFYQGVVAGLGGSVGCAVRLETRRSRVQPPPRSATFLRGD